MLRTSGACGQGVHRVSLASSSLYDVDRESQHQKLPSVPEDSFLQELQVLWAYRVQGTHLAADITDSQIPTTLTYTIGAEYLPSSSL